MSSNFPSLPQRRLALSGLSQGLPDIDMQAAPVRTISLAKARLQHILTATAINLARVTEWRAGIPVAKTRC